MPPCNSEITETMVRKRVIYVPTIQLHETSFKRFCHLMTLFKRRYATLYDTPGFHYIDHHCN